MQVEWYGQSAFRLTDGDVAAWAEHFLLHDRIAVAPGSAFGRSGEGWIRLCLAATEADLLAGIAKIPGVTRRGAASSALASR